MQNYKSLGTCRKVCPLFCRLSLIFYRTPIIYFILFAAAPFIADFYHVPLLSQVLRVQGLVLIINALQTVQTTQLRKQFRFKKIAIVLTLTSLLSLTTTIFLAYHGWGVWSLVAQNILVAAIPTTIYWLTNKWYPKLVFSFKAFKELFSFGIYMLLTSLTSVAANNIQGLLIGRIYNPTIMGYYSKAQETETLASNTIAQVITQVTYPLYSELQDDKHGMIMAIKKLTSVIAFLTFPLMYLLILIAKPLFILLFSEKWVDSVPYFQLLCLAGLAVCLQNVNFQTIAAIGKSKVMFNWSLFKQIVGVSFLIIGFVIAGIKGLLIGMVIKSWFIYMINAFLVSRHIGYKLLTQLRDLSPIMIISIASFLISFLIGECINANMYVVGIIELVLFGLSYMVISISLRTEAWGLIKEVASPYIVRISNKFK